MRTQLIVPWLLASVAIASPGDNLDEFQDCKYACEFEKSCPGSQIGYIDPSTNEFSDYRFDDRPLLLSTFFAWDCISDCDYQCQQIVTQLRIQNEEEIYQFHGKWPFLRLLTTQELFSTLFSIGNFIAHYHGYQQLTETIHRLENRGDRRRILLLRNYTYVAMAGMLAWTASTIFHWRDLLITEILDYFFAGGTVLTAFHAIFSRMTRLDKHPQMAKLFSWSVVLIFALHLLRLYIDWSYTYNMRFNIFFGVLQYLLLILLAYQNYNTLRSTQSHKRAGPYEKRQTLVCNLCIVPVLLVGSTAMAMSFELFDFFSYKWQIDSHALWHMCTIWPSWVLYGFFLKDFNFTTRENLE